MKLTRKKGGRIERLVGTAEAIGPMEAVAYWEWAVERGRERIATGVAPTRRQAIQAIRRAINALINGLDAYCILEDGEDSIGSAEYVRTVDVFVPQ